MNQEVFFSNISKLHTTEMGKIRILKNLQLDIDDIVAYLKNIIIDKNCILYKEGKNWYCETNDIKITINSYSYTIITAHKIKHKYSLKK